MQSDYQKLWAQCLAVIKDIVPEVVFNTWFVPITPLSYEDNKFTIQVPSQFFYEYLEEKYINVLKVTIHRVIGKGTILNYRVVIDKTTGGTIDYPTENSSIAVKKIIPKDANKAPSPFTQAPLQDFDSQLNPKYNFDNFFEGMSNRLVRVSGESVAQNPGRTTFNPLFVYGPSGVGKTHLCHAIGTRIKELHPEKKVLYVSSHLFRVQYTDATRKNTVNDFLYFYQNLDVLIMDDIQELLGMDKTQQQFFHIFNHLHQLGKQLVLTSDKAPVDLQGMEERLVTRLKWGLTAELLRPDIELRKKILKNKASQDGIVIPEDVLDFIANHVTDNIRDLEGVLVSLMANSVINNHEIDMSLAKRVIGQAIRLEKKQITVQLIQEIVCKYFNLEQSVIQTQSRKREIVQARQITMYLSKKYTDYSFSHIGKIVGKKDHATVLHACKTIKDQIEISKSFRSAVEEIEVQLKN
ncbi:chromosomal replication initiator protein [Parabacteroides sp. PF5-5]|uniref:chromosomal replication initiator protein DnaA n=1 Tax=unclassified Parabacteroides TaxID=2649774 RepID=UPI0024766957|nr:MULTISPECIES: chromosomal replication initiator protein DnaA [unclassified Parabacteroides]MDH6304527.1 chromosomal replication initiator protein [Parabacteroides sp. PH5-39]MDH6315321.1 chromosomal replication initiator protein [Parabacteroides sp. PF5-13]MDH6319185.1 chromosomal replication initiator protein [Parabacteroides sp. PH5-13]MDH6322916.1 chromosomal replication initiator protein [Parabacteroides sp. PH5-8]MDH6326512.1 chromosomal replication initiator protein [Parabacteroides s